MSNVLIVNCLSSTEACIEIETYIFGIAHGFSNCSLHLDSEYGLSNSLYIKLKRIKKQFQVTAKLLGFSFWSFCQYQSNQ